MIDMRQLDRTDLDRLGVAFDDPGDEILFIGFLREELEVRVGRRMASLLSGEQLDEFDCLTDSDEAARWVSENLPAYQEIISEEQYRLVWDVLRDRREISAAPALYDPVHPDDPLDLLGLSLRACNRLTLVGIYTVGDLLEKEDLLSVRGINPRLRTQIVQKTVDFLLPNESDGIIIEDDDLLSEDLISDLEEAS